MKFGIYFLILSLTLVSISSCSKNDGDSEPPTLQKITITAGLNSIEITPVPGTLTANTSVLYFNFEGRERKIIIKKVDAVDANANVNINNTDLIGDNSISIPANVNESIGLKNINNPNDIQIILIPGRELKIDNKEVTKATLTVSKETNFYYTDAANRSTYVANLSLFKTTVKNVAAAYADHDNSISGNQPLSVQVSFQ